VIVLFYAIEYFKTDWQLVFQINRDRKAAEDACQLNLQVEASDHQQEIQ